MLRLGSACTWLLVLALVGGATGSPPALDPDVVKGIQQFDDGYYDQAALTLDSAIQRLAGNAAAGEALQKAYIYLGATCVGLGQREKAKTQFRSATSLMVVQPGGKRGKIKDLSLASFGFSPKVTEVFEEAKREARVAAGERDSKLPVILVGVGLGGAAVVVGGATLLADRGSGAPGETYDADLAFVSSDPPPGSTISTGSPSSPKAVLRVTVAIVSPSSGQYSLRIMDKANIGNVCIEGASPMMQFAAHQRVTLTLDVLYPGIYGPLPACPLPFGAALSAGLLGNKPGGGGQWLLFVNLGQTYTFVP